MKEVPGFLNVDIPGLPLQLEAEIDTVPIPCANSTDQFEVPHRKKTMFEKKDVSQIKDQILSEGSDFNRL